MNVIIVERYTLKLVGKNPQSIFVFGDNLVKRGKALGQAIIRPMPNAFGIPTKREPARHDEAYFSDQDSEIEAVKAALRELYVLGKDHTLVFPLGGLGTGLAEMEIRSPKAWREMNRILERHFGIVNGAVTKIVEISPEP